MSLEGIVILVALVASIAAGLCALYVIWREKHPPHKHVPELLRIRNYRYVENINALKYSSTVGTPYTDAHWRCRDCGDVWMTKHRGIWTEDDFRGR